MNVAQARTDRRQYFVDSFDSVIDSGLGMSQAMAPIVALRKNHQYALKHKTTHGMPHDLSETFRSTWDHVKEMKGSRAKYIEQQMQKEKQDQQEKHDQERAEHDRLMDKRRWTSEIADKDAGRRTSPERSRGTSRGTRRTSPERSGGRRQRRSTRARRQTQRYSPGW